MSTAAVEMYSSFDCVLHSFRWISVARYFFQHLKFAACTPSNPQFQYPDTLNNQGELASHIVDGEAFDTFLQQEGREGRLQQSAVYMLQGQEQ